MSDSKRDEAEANTSQSLGSSIARAVMGLAIFAIVTAGIIAVTQVSTAERIQQEIRKARSKALLEIVPEEAHDNDLLQDAFWLQSEELGLVQKREAFIARKDGAPAAIILPVRSTEGYTGPIRMIVGIDTKGELLGVRVIEHKETPGLGDKIDRKKSDWIIAFNGRSLSNTPEDAWQVKKDGGDFDQLTGATITPRAIVKSVHKAMLFFDQHRAQLLAQAPGSVFEAKE